MGSQQVGHDWVANTHFFPKFIWWSLKFHWDSVQRWRLWWIIKVRCGHGGGAFMMGLAPLIRKDTREVAESLLLMPCSHKEGLWAPGEKVAVCRPAREPSTELDPAGPTTSGLQDCEKINSCRLSQPVDDSLLWQPELRLGLSLTPLGKRIIGSRCHWELQFPKILLYKTLYPALVPDSAWVII